MTLPWIIGLAVWGAGAFISWLIVIFSAIDADWKFSEMALALVWPLTLIWLFVFSAGDPRDLPKWIERHWG